MSQTPQATSTRTEYKYSATSGITASGCREHEQVIPDYGTWVNYNLRAAPQCVWLQAAASTSASHHVRHEPLPPGITDTGRRVGCTAAVSNVSREVFASLHCFLIKVSVLHRSRVKADAACASPRLQRWRFSLCSWAGSGLKDVMGVAQGKPRAVKVNNAAAARRQRLMCSHWRRESSYQLLLF